LFSWVYVFNIHGLNFLWYALYGRPLSSPKTYSALFSFSQGLSGLIALALAEAEVSG